MASTGSQSPNGITVSSSAQRTNKSFAESLSCPKRDQSVFLTSIPGVSNDEYIDQLETLTDVKNISHISKISKQRVCVFFKSSEVAGALIGKSITINNEIIPIKAAVEPNKKVIISNVQPFIPNETIMAELDRAGVVTTSPISNVRASLSKPGREHIGSFRRQVFIKASCIEKLPGQAKVNHDYTNYWIYFSCDSSTCFKCKKPGHLFRNCPDQDRDDETLTRNGGHGVDSDAAAGGGDFPSLPQSLSAVSTVLTESALVPSKPNLKRPPSSSVASDSSASPPRGKKKINSALSTDGEFSAADNPFKKPTNSFAHDDSGLQAVQVTKNEEKSFFTENLKDFKLETEKQPPAYDIIFDDFVNAIVELRGSSVPMEVLKSLGIEARQFSTMLESCYGFLDNGKAKNRVTRLKKKISAAVEKSGEPYDSDSSAKSS